VHVCHCHMGEHDIYDHLQELAAKAEECCSNLERFQSAESTVDDSLNSCLSVRLSCRVCCRLTYYLYAVVSGQMYREAVLEATTHREMGEALRKKLRAAESTIEKLQYELDGYREAELRQQQSTA
jgi:hypothetical protein